MSDKFIYGTSFQTKILSALISDMEYSNLVIDILEPSYFDNEGISFLYKRIRDYLIKYKKKPTAEYFKVEYENIEDDKFKKLVKDTLKDVYNKIESEDLEYIKTTSLDFCKNQSVKNAIEKSIDLLKTGNWDEIRRTLDEALKAGNEKNLGCEYFEADPEKRYTDNPRCPIPTGLQVFDDLFGGLGKGELGIIAAPPGIGKSTLLRYIAKTAVEQGKRVLLYTLELYEDYIAKKFDTLFTGLLENEIMENMDSLRDTLKNKKGNLIIKYFPTKKASVLSLQSHIEKVISQVGEIDMIIIDYPDLLKSSFTAERKDLEIQNIYEECRGMAGEYKVPCWVASQLGKDSYRSKVSQADQLSGAFAKLMVADIVMILNRTLKDKLENKAKISIMKSRFSKDGKVFLFDSDLDLGVFHFIREVNENGEDLEDELSEQNMESVKKYMKSKYEKFEKSNNKKDEDIIVKTEIKQEPKKESALSKYMKRNK